MGVKLFEKKEYKDLGKNGWGVGGLMTMHKMPTQEDVAKLANVSRSTVSLVINGRDEGRIPEKTRQRVLRVIREIGYGPNIAARMLARQVNHLIGVFTYERFFPYETDNFFYPFVVGIERQASKEGYNLLLYTRDSGEKTRGIYRDDTNVLSMADGSILMGSRPKAEEIRQLVRDGRPFVYIGRRDIPGCVFDWVTSDYVSAGYDATMHLIDLGHRRIGYVEQRADERYTYVQDRIAGCRKAVDEARWASATLHLVPSRLLTDPSAFVRRVHDLGLTAIVCRSNRAMARVWRMLLDAGRRVPRDVSLVSLTDETARFPVDMKPTVISLNRTRVGEQAVRLLVERLKGRRTEPTHMLVSCDLTVGETTGRMTER